MLGSSTTVRSPGRRVLYRVDDPSRRQLVERADAGETALGTV